MIKEVRHRSRHKKLITPIERLGLVKRSIAPPEHAEQSSSPKILRTNSAQNRQSISSNQKLKVKREID